MYAHSNVWIFSHLLKQSLQSDRILYKRSNNCGKPRFSENIRQQCVSCFRKAPITPAPSTFRKQPSATRPLSGRSGCCGFNINSNGGGSGSVNSGSSSYRRLDQARNLQVSGNSHGNRVVSVSDGREYDAQTAVRSSTARRSAAPLSLCWNRCVCLLL